MAVPMYPAKSGSPTAFITVGITAISDSITMDADVLPDAPNMATLGNGATAEVVLYATKVGTTISDLTRGFSGTTAQTWPIGTAVSRRYTSYDHDAFRQNLENKDIDGGTL